MIGSQHGTKLKMLKTESGLKFVLEYFNEFFFLKKKV